MAIVLEEHQVYILDYSTIVRSYLLLQNYNIFQCCLPGGKKTTVCVLFTKISEHQGQLLDGPPRAEQRHLRRYLTGLYKIISIHKSKPMY